MPDIKQILNPDQWKGNIFNGQWRAALGGTLTVREFPIIPCNLCGSQPNLQRQQVKQMLNDWERRFPGRIETMFRSLANVVPSHLLDARLFDFAGLQATGMPDPEGDIAFDAPALPPLAPQAIDFMAQDD